MNARAQNEGKAVLGLSQNHLSVSRQEDFEHYRIEIVVLMQ